MGGSGNSSELSALRSEISAMRAEANAKEMAALRSEMSNMRNDMTYVKRDGMNMQSTPMQPNFSAKELSEMIASAVRNAVVAVVPPRETRLSKATEASRAQVVKSETSQPITAAYPPDSVTTTVTTTRVDTTKKTGEQPVSRDSRVGDDMENRLFDVGGFYDPATERDLKSLNRRTESRKSVKRSGK